MKLKGIFPFLVLAFLVWSGAGSVQAGAPARSEHKVLFIASYHPGFPTFFDQVEGLRQVFDGHGIHFDIEFMDSKRFEPALAEQMFLDAMSRKLKVLPPYDLVITADDAALHFAIRYRTSLFANWPLVFLGVNDARFGLSFDAVDDVTGVLEQPSFIDTVELFQHLMGNKANLVVITDASDTGKTDTQHFIADMDAIRFDRYQLVSLEDFSVDELLNQLRKLHPPDAIMVISAYRERGGGIVRIEEFIQSLSSKTSVPIFHLWQHGIGQGMLGGKVISHRKQATLAAEMAVDILAGTSPGTLPVIRQTSNRWLFDYAQMQRFGFDVDDMPEGSRFINQPDTLYERYQTYVSALLGFIAALFLIIASLVVRMRTRQAFERKLVQLNRQLETNILNRTQALDQARQEAENLLRERDVILNNSLAGIVLLKDRHVEWVNGYAEEMFGYSSEEVIGRSVDFIYARPADFDKLAAESPPVLERGGSYRAEFEFRRKDGSLLWGIINGKALNPANLAEGVLFIVMDITLRKQAEDQLREANHRLATLASTDPLTGLINRRHVNQLIGEEIRRYNRYQQPLAVILLDIDHFKALNDRHGHDVGDRILKEVALLLKHSLRSVDAVARWGGEEFLVVCPSTELMAAAKLAELLRIRFELQDFGLGAPITASFGVASYQSGESLDTLIKAADEALYRAKEQRNCVRVEPVTPQTHP